ncbi:nitrile hydratase subunit beta [Pseudonocardia sp. WMMC193]|uniref:nitrile hydratase subunit beta n=1 Tax=Pseudonocardia sp. WMMC193 TaxID=2911965 RepID=UPI001F02D97A|nr:nitrile hydratase subunit beta [Pseudonocardia sp. WMMC193]MCF7553418.1 nitrile hydratase subunit beta [Pseudonocardia sp. WMMC193]
MHGPHDVGGRDGLGPVIEVFKDPEQPAFRYPFEGRMHALTAMAIANGAFNLDEQRHGIELMPWAHYTDSNYYEHWLYSVEKLLNDKGIITHEEIDERVRTQAPGRIEAHPEKPTPSTAAADRMIKILWEGTPHDVPTDVPPRFAEGDAIVVRNINVTTHNRLPGYLNGVRGTVARHHGAHHDPATSAHAQRDVPHHLYTVRFAKLDLWGPEAAAEEGAYDLYADLFEDYLDTAPTTTPGETA